MAEGAVSKAAAETARRRNEPLKDARRIDFHTHLVPHSWPDFSRRYGYGGFVHIDHDEAAGTARLMRDSQVYKELSPASWDVSQRLADMDAAGVDVQVLSTIPEMFSYWAKADDAADLARILNNDMEKQIKKFPERFVGLGTIPMQAPELAVAELRRCVSELGFAGVVVGTHINDWGLDAEELIAFWEAAEELGAIVFVHPNDLDMREENDDLLLPRLVGMPAEMCHAVTCFLRGGILDKFPRLKVCFAQGAGTFPYVRGQIETGLSALGNTARSLEVACSLSTATYAGRLFCDSIVHSSEATDYLLRTMSDSMVVFGSDYPAPLGHTIAPYDKFAHELKEGLQAAGGSEEALARVLGLNAAGLLGILQAQAPSNEDESQIQGESHVAPA